MSNIPIKCLRKETRDLISALLNPRKIITNENGQSRDWYGLAELCGIGGEKIPNIERTCDPTSKILELWIEKNGDESTTSKLISYLQILDRFDVIDDAILLIEKDAEYYKEHPEGFTVPRIEIDDRDIITYDDNECKRAGLPPQTYDAFVLFDDDDIGFATDIIQTLEGQYSMKLCVKDRDVIGGESNYDSVIRLISTRCNRVVVVVSPSFLKSPSNKYFYTLAQMDGIEREERKIVPCILREYPDMPLQIKAYHVLNYSRLESAFGNFWDQLYKSVKVALPPSSKSNLSLKEKSTKSNLSLKEKSTKSNLLMKDKSTKSNLPLKEKNQEVPKNTTDSTKVTNHVKFIPERYEKIDTKPQSPVTEIPIAYPPTPSTPIEPEPYRKEIKKKNSLYQKFRSILPHKKGNKLKIAVAN